MEHSYEFYHLIGSGLMGVGAGVGLICFLWAMTLREKDGYVERLFSDKEFYDDERWKYEVTRYREADQETG